MIIDYNNKEQLQKLIEEFCNSDDYTKLEYQISENNARFRDLPQRLKYASLFMFQAGIDGYIDELWQYFYSRKIPTIEEFLTEKYIGLNNNFLFPKWRDELNEHFAVGTQRYELIVGGAIGIGKTSFTNIAHVYNLLRVCSLRYPQIALGQAPMTLLVCQLFSITLEKAQMAVIKPFMDIIKDCGAFERVKKEIDFNDFKGSDKIPYVDGGGNIVFPKSIYVMTGSRVSHALSFSAFAASLDEAEFRIAADAPVDAIETYGALKERVRSRFMGSRFILLTMMSSAKYSIGIMADYMKKIKQGDPHSKFVGYPIWEVKNKYPYEKGHFYVMRGTQTHPHKILDHAEGKLADEGKYELSENCLLIKVPEGEYRKSFETDLPRSIRDLAGIQELGGEFLFPDTSGVEYPFLCPEINLDASISDHRSLLEKLPKQLFVEIPGGRRLARYGLAPRYIHVDNAEVAEAGLTMLHKEYVVRKMTDENGAEVQLKITIYVVDLICKINAKDRISLDAIERLIVDLARVCEVSIMGLSADQYQSSQMRQAWESERIMFSPDRYKPKLISVDRTNIPYMQGSSIVAHNCLAVGRCPQLRVQLINIQKDDKGDIFTHVRKDMSDSLMGSLHTAIMNPGDEPIYQFVKPEELVSKDIKTVDIAEWEEI